MNNGIDNLLIKQKLTLDDARAINDSICTMYLVRAGMGGYDEFTAAAARVSGLSLQAWMEATTMIDEENKKIARQGQLIGKAMTFTTTCNDRAIAALYTFLNHNVNDIIVFDGVNGLAILPTKVE